MALKARSVLFAIDAGREICLYAVLLIGPWYFGGTTRGAIHLLNGFAIALGILTAARCWLERLEPSVAVRPPLWGRARIRVMLGLTAAFLVLCAVQCLNARAYFSEDTLGFVYRDQAVMWLPHSYDRDASLFATWGYASLAVFFWSALRWLVESDQIRRSLEAARDKPPLPGWSRPQRLLWVVSASCFALCVTGVLQRLDGGNKLLWLVEPRWNNTAESQFGPYAYRSNAAQLINLVWPLTLGLAWECAARRRRPGRKRGGTGPQVLLAPMAGLMAIAPFVSLSRGGSAVALAQAAICGAVLVSASRMKRQTFARVSAAAVLAGGILVWIGADRLRERFMETDLDDLTGRRAIYANSQELVDIEPLWGVGAGAFATVYKLTLEPLETWEAFAHDDWLEARITVGWVGLGCLAGIAALLLFASPAKGAQRWRIPGLLARCGMAGCLLHAKFDFPFQVYSVAAYFLAAAAFAEFSSRGDNSIDSKGGLGV